MKSKVDKSGVDKSVCSCWFKQTKSYNKNDVVKKDVYNAKIQNIECEIPDITNLATKTTLNAKINEAKWDFF